MKEAISYITIMAIIIIVFNGVLTYILSAQISEIKQDIVEIKKDYSYDPKDAK
jgi:hypothetical protein